MAYNSQFTGAQIDEAIADVRSNKDAWNGKQDVILASGAAVGDLIKVKAVDARGKPTAWEVAAAGTDYLTEAPVTSVNGKQELSRFAKCRLSPPLIMENFCGLFPVRGRR